MHLLIPYVLQRFLFWTDLNSMNENQNENQNEN